MARNLTSRPQSTVTRFISVTSPAADTVVENEAFSQTLTSDATVTWALQGGEDMHLFTLVGSTLGMAAKDFGAPVDANADNAYEVVVRATDEYGFTKLHTVTVTVTDAL